MEVYILFTLLLLSACILLVLGCYIQNNKSTILNFWKCPISYYKNSSATFHLELLISGDINPNPGPETLINTPTNATQLHEISYSRSELLNLRNAPFTDVTALSYSAVSQINCFGILANRPQTYRPTHSGKKAGRRRMEKLAQLALRPDQLPRANLTTSTSNIWTPNVHDESKLQLCVLNTQSMCNKSDEFVDFVLGSFGSCRHIRDMV